MNAIPASDLLRQAEQLSAEVTRPIPGSRKIHVEGSLPGVRVPMREIVLTKTPTLFGGEENAPVTVYDCSGAYTDPTAAIDLAKGLPALRAQWIAARGDSERLPGISSEFGRAREHDPKLAHVRFPNRVAPRRAQAGANVSQMHYAKRGIITPEMEFVAIRENQRLDAVHEAHLLNQHRGESFGAAIQKVITPEFVRDEIARGRAILPNNIKPGKRADDHRPQFPHQDQREYRQQRGVVRYRRRSRKAGLGDPLGCRHGDGPVHGQAHPRDA